MMGPRLAQPWIGNPMQRRKTSSIERARGMDGTRQRADPSSRRPYAICWREAILSKAHCGNIVKTSSNAKDLNELKTRLCPGYARSC
jgi:hypothetical protein